MIYITQLIYVKEGMEDVFHEFESHAIPLIDRHNGALMLRVRTDRASKIKGTIEQPYEIHLVQFQTEEDFERFMHDEERKKFLHLKEASIRSALLFKGERL